MFALEKTRAALIALLALGSLAWVGLREPVVATPAAAADAPAPAVTGRTGTTAPADEIPFADPHAAAVETPSAPGAWGGPRTGREPTLSDRVVKYEIDATLDPAAHTIAAEQKLTWQNRSDRPIPSVYFHLYLNAFEGPGSTFASEARERGFTFRSDVPIEDGEWGHIELERVTQSGADVPWMFVHPDGGPESDHTVVRLDLPTPVAPGGSTVIDTTFRARLPRVVARTGWFGNFHMVGQWFPKLGVLELAGERGATGPRWNVHEFHPFSEFYADFGEYDVRISVPKGFQVAATGVERGAPIERGELVTRRFVQGDVHDFAWMAVDNFAPPLTGSYDGPGSPHVDVKVFYPAEYAASAAPTLQATIDSIRWFSETLGPYPYETSTVIIPPFNAAEAGGMEYQTLFTTLSFAKLEPNTLDAASLDFVAIHEFGHGYFYGILASNEFEEPLLDEGLNEYWDARMMRERGQDIYLTTPFFKALGIAPRANPFAFRRMGGSAIDQNPADPIGQNASGRFSTQSYGQVYSRTATLMHDLEARLGRDVIERAFRAYYAKWRFRHPSTADFREALIEAAGERAPLEQVFRQHVYGVEPIDDRIENLTSEEILPQAGGTLDGKTRSERTRAVVQDEIKQAREAYQREHPDTQHGQGPYPYRTIVTVRRLGASVPQTLVVRFADGSTENVRWDDEQRWRRFIFVKPFKAVSAELDPERRVYLDHTKLNDGRTLERNGAASRRWAGDIAAVAQVFYALLGTL